MSGRWDDLPAALRDDLRRRRAENRCRRKAEAAGRRAKQAEQWAKVGPPRITLSRVPVATHRKLFAIGRARYALAVLAGRVPGPTTLRAVLMDLVEAEHGRLVEAIERAS